jgi:triosephosphate isomerase
MRKPLVAGNWKMNLEPEGGAALVAELLPLVADSTDVVDVVVCPSNIGLAAARAALAGGGVTLGSGARHAVDRWLPVGYTRPL